MSLAQSSEWFALAYCSQARNIGLGALCSMGGLFCVAVSFLAGGAMIVLLIGGIGLCFCGLRTLFVRPSIFCFDRATGKLTVVRRTLVSHRTEHWALADVQYVLLLVSNQENGDRFAVSLALKTPDDAGKHAKRLRVTVASHDRSKQLDNAQAIASFLTVPVEERPGDVWD